MSSRNVAAFRSMLGRANTAALAILNGYTVAELHAKQRWNHVEIGSRIVPSQSAPNLETRYARAQSRRRACEANEREGARHAYEQEHSLTHMHGRTERMGARRRGEEERKKRREKETEKEAGKKEPAGGKKRRA
eukprot:4848148-Pleurochrysis_carterae.AAC.1